MYRLLLYVIAATMIVVGGYTLFSALYNSNSSRLDTRRENLANRQPTGVRDTLEDTWKEKLSKLDGTDIEPSVEFESQFYATMTPQFIPSSYERSVPLELQELAPLGAYQVTVFLAGKSEKPLQEILGEIGIHASRKVQFMLNKHQEWSPNFSWRKISLNDSQIVYYHSRDTPSDAPEPIKQLNPKSHIAEVVLRIAGRNAELHNLHLFFSQEVGLQEVQMLSSLKTSKGKIRYNSSAPMPQMDPND